MGFDDFINAAESWDPPDMALNQALTPVRRKDSGEPVDGAVVRHYLKLALEQRYMAPAPEMASIRDALYEEDLRTLAHNVFNVWLAEPNREIQKGAFLLYGLHATNADVAELWALISDWLQTTDPQKHEWALDGVLALSLSRGEIAPMIVETISRTTTDESVRAAAHEILGGLVENLSITWDEAQDYIIPTLGFDDNGERVIEAGSSRFIAVITPFLTLELTDANGMLVAGTLENDIESDDTASDDMAAALTQFYALEKALDTVVKVQSRRLRLFMLMGRNWDKSMWERLFIHSPILRKFTGTLVWGVYADQVLHDTFICRANDGGYTRVDGAPFDFDAIGDEMRINPVHVFEMPGELVEAWRARIAADGLLQPLRQMDVELKVALDYDDVDDVCINGQTVCILKGFDRDDCSDENRYRLETLARLLGAECKELFLDIYYNGNRCLQERIYYPLSYEEGDPEMDAIVEAMLAAPEGRAYPWLILALERNKNAYWLGRLYEHLRDGIEKRIPNEFGARGLLHADLYKYYDIARDTFGVYWEKDLPTDMGIYAFESNSQNAVKDILPYVLKITPENADKARGVSLHSMIQAAYRHLTPEEFYAAFMPVFENEATRPEFVEAFMSRIKYDWNKRDLSAELQMDIPVKQLLNFDSRWYKHFLENGLVDFVVHSITKDMPATFITQMLGQIIERDFKTCEDLDAFYKYALGMAVMGSKDFLYDMLQRVKDLMVKLPYRHDTLRRLAYHMERKATAYGDEFWLQQFILLDPVGFAGVFEIMRDNATGEDKALIDQILQAVYEIVYKK